QHGVDVAVARGPGRAHAAGAPGAQGRAGEGVDVEPVVDRLVGGHGIADAVGPLGAAHGLEGRAAAVLQGDGHAASRLGDAAELPAAQVSVGHARPVGAVLAALAPGQLVGGGEHEVVPDVEEGGTVVPLRVVGVGPVRPLAGGEGGAVVAEVVGEGLAEGVGR